MDLAPIPCAGLCIPAVTVSAAAPGGAAALRVQARGPSRFLSVEAATGGGSVEVEVVQEGSLRLRSGGGSIAVAKVGAWLQGGGLQLVTPPARCSAACCTALWGPHMHLPCSAGPAHEKPTAARL